MRLRDERDKSQATGANSQKPDFNTKGNHKAIKALQEFSKLLARRAANVDYAKREWEE